MKNKTPFGITYIDGQPWLVGLPDGGSSRNTAEQSEFSQVADLVGRESFHCNMASWCSNYAQETRFDEEGEGFFWTQDGFVTRYDAAAENWDIEREGYRGSGTGFRPVLIPANPETLLPDPGRISLYENGRVFTFGTLYMDGKPLAVPVEAVRCPEMKYNISGDVPAYHRDALLKIGDTSEKPEEQIKFIKFGDKLFCDRVLIGCISQEDLEKNLVVEKTPTKTHSNMKQINQTQGHSQPDTFNLWARLGVTLTVTQEEAAVLCGKDYDEARNILLNLIRSDRCSLDGETYFPEVDQSETDYAIPEVQFDFDFAPTPLQVVPQKMDELQKGSPSFDERLADASARASSSPASEGKNQEPEH